MMTFKKVIKMIERHELVDEVLRLDNIGSGIILAKLKCNHKYIADILSGDNNLEKYMNNMKIFMPPGALLQYEIEVEVQEE